jgi:hypothetical protein
MDAKEQGPLAARSREVGVSTALFLHVRALLPFLISLVFDTARAPRRTACAPARANHHWPHMRGSTGRSAPVGVALLGVGFSR